MREILFRGKRLDNGEWVYGYYLFDIGNLIMTLPGVGGGITHLVGAETVGQYTGSTDKNGRKIFEGDIIHLEYSQVFFGGEYFGEYTAEVSYKEGCFITDGINNGDEIETPLSGFDNDEVEIIGNIHDNPELLGGESDG